MMVVICRDSFHQALTARQLMDGAVFVGRAGSYRETTECVVFVGETQDYKKCHLNLDL